MPEPVSATAPAMVVSATAPEAVIESARPVITETSVLTPTVQTGDETPVVPAVAPERPGETPVDTVAAIDVDAHGGHGYNFSSLNEGHNFPYPAIEFTHGHPVLILHAARYAQINYGTLSSHHDFAQAAPTPAISAWANEYVAKPGYQGPVSADLAKAMTVAQSQSTTMPRYMSMIIPSHQTFWSTVALVLGMLVLLVFARRKPEQVKPVGRVQNVLEALVLFVRDDIVRPNFAHQHDHAHSDAVAHSPSVAFAAKTGDGWTPFFAALFLALLACNLFGLIPIFGTATGDFAVTLVWGLIIGALMLTMALLKNGPAYFIKQVPIPFKADPVTLLLWPFLFVIETLQLIIRPLALSIRLFANMLAGHIVLLVFASLGFIVFASNPDHALMPSALGIVGWVLTIAFYAFELLVAFLQAYIFTLLSAVFVSLCANPEH